MSEAISDRTPESDPTQHIEEHTVVLGAAQGLTPEGSETNSVPSGGEVAPESEHHFADEFCAFLQTQPEYKKRASTSERAALEPSLAHVFIVRAVINMDPLYKRSWHRFVKAVKVTDLIHSIVEKHGAYTPEPDRFAQVAQMKRTEYLRKYREYALRYYNRYPEVLGAYNLQRHLMAISEPGLADGVNVLLAAYGGAIASLPDNEKKLPPAFYDHKIG